MFYRKVRRVQGLRVELDVPFTAMLRVEWGEITLQRMERVSDGVGVLQEVGVEKLSIIIESDGGEDENNFWSVLYCMFSFSGFLYIVFMLCIGSGFNSGNPLLTFHIITKTHPHLAVQRMHGYVSVQCLGLSTPQFMYWIPTRPPYRTVMPPILWAKYKASACTTFVQVAGPSKFYSLT
jgi:hypothetical protein